MEMEFELENLWIRKSKKIVVNFLRHSSWNKVKDIFNAAFK